MQNNIHDVLVMFEKQDIPTKLQKEEIEPLNTKVTKSPPMLSLNHKVIVTWFCESDVSHIHSSKGFCRE